MWIVTDKAGKFVGLVNPTRGKANLAYQLKRRGWMSDHGQLEGGGYARRVVDGGHTTYYVVKLPNSFGPSLSADDLVTKLHDTDAGLDVGATDERNV